MLVDHLVLTHTIKSKAEALTTRIKRLLELTSSYSFNLYYMKGKYMILSDFLSRQTHDDSNPHDIIPISFNMNNMLHKRYYKIAKKRKIFSTDAFANKIKQGNITRSPWYKEDTRYKFIGQKTESNSTN